MNNQRINIFIVIMAFIGLLFVNGAYYSSLHNIDLSWNVKHLDLVDCNGIICNDIEVFYQNGIMFAWFYPILNSIVLSIIFIFGFRIYLNKR